MTKKDVQQLIQDYGYEEVIIFSDPDYADALQG